MAKRRPSSIVASAPPPPQPTAPEQHDYRAEMDGDNLRRAHEIMADKPRHSKALAHLKSQHEAIGRALGHEDADAGGDRHGQGFRRLNG